MSVWMQRMKKQLWLLKYLMEDNFVWMQRCHVFTNSQKISFAYLKTTIHVWGGLNSLKLLLVMANQCIPFATISLLKCTLKFVPECLLTRNLKHVSKIKSWQAMPFWGGNIFIRDRDNKEISHYQLGKFKSKGKNYTHWGINMNSGSKGSISTKSRGKKWMTIQFSSISIWSYWKFSQEWDVGFKCMGGLHNYIREGCPHKAKLYVFPFL